MRMNTEVGSEKLWHGVARVIADNPAARTAFTDALNRLDALLWAYARGDVSYEDVREYELTLEAMVTENGQREAA